MIDIWGYMLWELSYSCHQGFKPHSSNSKTGRHFNSLPRLQNFLRHGKVIFQHGNSVCVEPLLKAASHLENTRPIISMTAVEEKWERGGKVTATDVSDVMFPSLQSIWSCADNSNALLEGVHQAPATRFRFGSLHVTWQCFVDPLAFFFSSVRHY
jgi:hypothetical protein